MTSSETTSADFVMSRVFDAPRALVWECFTRPERMKEWWGPRGYVVLSSNMDLRPGGIYHYGMSSPDGVRIWGRMVYREIVPPEKIVFINSFSDEHGGLARHPMAPSWPIEMHSIFTFEELPDRKTRFTIRWRPHNPTAEEQQAFDAGHASMNGGWSGTLDGLDAYLARAGAAAPDALQKSARP